MSSKRILGIAGAAMIGTLAGTGAVHAVIGIGDSGTTGAATFARETLRSDRNIPPQDGNGGPYYEASAQSSNSNELDVSIPVGMALPASTTNVAVITVVLEDLVMTGVSLANAVRFTTDASPPVVVANAVGTLLTGGLRGERRAQFSVTTGATAVAADNLLWVDLGRVGLDPTKNGTITVTIQREVAGVPVTKTTRLANAVKVLPALDVTATPTMQTASVEDGFMKFVGGTGVAGVATDRLAANVGNLHIGIATTTPPTTFYNAGRGDVPNAGVVSAVSHIASGAAIVFTGQTSFLADQGEGDDAKKLVYIDTNANCSTDDSPTSIVDADDEDKLKAALDDFDDDGGAYLCLKVDGKTAIPATDAYTAAITYTSILGANAAFPPEPSTETLGSIGRDGSTVRIAYLTTNQKYNQHLVVVNRSNSAVDYSMTFKAGDGTTAMPGSAASGTLSSGRTVLKVRDLVTFDNGGNGGHGSAELAVVVASSMLDVATVTTTRSDGSTDTVVWDTQ